VSETPKENYTKIVEHYEQCFEKHGPSHRGVDWPNQHDLHKRFRVMIDMVLQKGPCTLLDFGCGTGLLFDWLEDNELSHAINYTGCDMSEKFINFCKQKFKDDPENFFQIDLLKTPEKLGKYDYIVANGVFTMKLELSQQEMWDHFTKVIPILYKHANKGVAFNLMSKQVDWERNDLFHVSLDQLALFLTKNLSRHFVIRNDYGLYEYTVHLYKEPVLK
jgi:cyclopropane fatty-acyl-phospholipid synthase-like methyltransferase